MVPEIETNPRHALHSNDFPELERIVILGSKVPDSAVSWSDMMASGKAVSTGVLANRARQVAPDDMTLIMYASGTTGCPKGVMHCHNLQHNIIDIANRLGYRSNDIILMNWPLFHVLGLYLGPLFTVCLGTRMVLTTVFDATESLRLMKRNASRASGASRTRSMR